MKNVLMEAHGHEQTGKNTDVPAKAAIGRYIYSRPVGKIPYIHKWMRGGEGRERATKIGLAQNAPVMCCCYCCCYCCLLKSRYLFNKKK